VIAKHLLMRSFELELVLKRTESHESSEIQTQEGEKSSHLTE